MSQAVKVSALVHYLKAKLESDIRISNIIVQGEISNFTNHRSGHWYFSIKDENARISCIMFATYASKSRYIPKDGDKVLVRGSVSMFEASGNVQLYCNAIKQDGIGDLYVQYEQLLSRCQARGLFAAEHKKPLPKYPEKIAVVTGNKTAALQDVLTTLKKRWPIAQVTLYPVLVQGEESANQIITALKAADDKAYDVILLVRGGGSIEDLWSFNNEGLALCIYELNTPVITGVGHETDTTIADYVADVRAATPTAAATLAAPDKEEILKLLDKYRNHLMTDALNRLNEKSLLLDFQSEKLSKVKNVLKNKENELNDIIKNILMLNHQHQDKFNSEILYKQNRLNLCVNNYLNSYQYDVEKKENELNNAIMLIANNTRKHFNEKVLLLDAYSPLKILSRGYAITSHNGVNVSSIDQININEEISIRLEDGMLDAKVINKEKFNG